MMHLRKKLDELKDLLADRFTQAQANRIQERYAAQIETDLEKFQRYLRNTRTFNHSSRGSKREYFSPIIPQFGIARRMVQHLADNPTREDFRFALLTAHESLIEPDGTPDHNLRLRFGFNVLKQIEWSQEDLRELGETHDAGYLALQDLKTHILKQHVKSLNEIIQTSPIGGFSVSSMGIGSASSLHTWVDNCRMYEFEDPEINAALISVFENVSKLRIRQSGADAGQYVQNYINELKAKGLSVATSASTSPAAQPA